MADADRKRRQFAVGQRKLRGGEIDSFRGQFRDTGAGADRLVCDLDPGEFLLESGNPFLIERERKSGARAGKRFGAPGCLPPKQSQGDQRVPQDALHGFAPSAVAR